ncbi:selenide, water dikinase SelD [Pseudogemmobacter blasticus]|nr:selenide, water dikinase SelD [Fuscovulum blasticum]
MMPAAPFPLVRDLVLVGGGHAHALVLRSWAMDPLPGVRLTVINPGPAAPYTGMLPGLIAGHYARDEIMIDLVRLARYAGARVILSRATGLDLAARCVLLNNRPPLAFDVASVDIGIGSGLPDIPGYDEHAVAAKPLGHYADAWEAFVARKLPAPRLVILGAGVGGVELALASAHRLRAGGAEPQITLIERAEAALPNIGRAARATLLRHAQAAGIAFRTGTTARAIGPGTVTLSSGETLPSDFTLAVAGTQPQPWLAQTGLASLDGFLVVGPTLQTSDPAIFAAGDCAHLSHAPRPKAGVFAVREAPVLLANLRAALTGGPMRAYHPQRDYLKLVSTGGRGAVADKFGLRSGGGWLWRLKDRIDRRFMAMFADYPAMPAPALPDPAPQGLAQAMGDKPLCGGCGAKVGPAALRAALASLPAPQRPDVLSGPGDDAALLRAARGVQALTTDHLRAFTNDPRLMARLAAVHALGDIWAMGAAPQAALAQITLPRLSEPLQTRSLAEIMEEAAQVFRAAGADLVGGHTSTGDELTIGFTVTGLADRPVPKAGARPGDAILLTKAIGSGTILAAEMALARVPGLILGEAVVTCLAAMARPLGPAAEILAPVAHAMTDVTGFGLAGHLLEILQASGVSARIDLRAVPMLPGAVVLAGAGQASSLAPANRAAIDWLVDAPPGPETDLLFDPQTCGGLLACVPADQADALLARLRAAGDGVAVRIGTVTEGPPKLVVSRS